MKKLVYALTILICLVISQFSEARYEGDKWIPDTPAQKASQEKNAIKQRVDFASGFERTLLSKGMDVDATASGPEKKHFKLKYILMNKPLVYKLTVEGNMMENLHALGFTKAVLTDGHYNTWNFDLKKIFSKDTPKKGKGK
jgi:hypothetical protein